MELQAKEPLCRIIIRESIAGIVRANQRLSVKCLLVSAHEVIAGEITVFEAFRSKCLRMAPTKSVLARLERKYMLVTLIVTFILDLAILELVRDQHQA